MSNLREVAHQAGVSISTVSRVINQPELVDKTTIAKVQKTIQALDYKPNRVASRLRAKTKSGRLIGLMISDINNPFYSEIVRGVENIAVQNNCAIIICNTDDNADKERYYIDLMTSELVDGIILAPAGAAKADNIQYLKEKNVPVVCYDRRVIGVDVDTVVVDNVNGGYLAVERLIKLGHTKIGCIAGLADISTTKERITAYENAHKRFNIPINKNYIVTGDSRKESARLLTRDLLTANDRPTALFTGNDLITLGAIEAVHEVGLRLPDDIAVIGYDDNIAALALKPALTVVSQPTMEIGHRVAELLLDRIRRPEKRTIEVILQPSLIVRESCGGPVHN